MTDNIFIESLDFCLETLVQKALIGETPDDDLFDIKDLSPLTSPEPSPPPSPGPTALPILPHFPLYSTTDLAPTDIDDLSSLTSLDSSSTSPLHPTSDAAAITVPSGPQPIVDNTGPLTSADVKKKTRGRKRKSKRDKAQSHANRKKKRLTEKAQKVSIATRPAVVDKYVRFDNGVHTNSNTEEGPTTKAHYIARKSVYESTRLYNLDEVMELGFKLEQWDGRTPKPIFDRDRRLIAVMIGHPESEDWAEKMKLAASMLEEARGQCNIDTSQHRRGLFPSLRCGVSHGGGQPQPGNLCNTLSNNVVLERLNTSEPFQRISGFTSSFATWSPDLYHYYQGMIEKLHHKYPHLNRPFPNSVFSATTYNLGPTTICFPHTDSANLPFGWCAVSALGDFDHTKGGHLILWDCGLVIEFPSGCSCLIPSAIVAHSNTTIAEHETRYSFTQYTAGGLFRWVEQGFKTRREYLKGFNKEGLEELMEEEEKRWLWGLSLFRTSTCPD